MIRMAFSSHYSFESLMPFNSLSDRAVLSRRIVCARSHIGSFSADIYAGIGYDS